MWRDRPAHFYTINYFAAAVEDCKRAIDMDPNYGKAYGRMGLAYSSMEKHREAIECFKKALEIEPENESYKTNLALAEEKSRQPPSAAAGMPGFPPGGVPDLGGLLNNPALMNMATSLLSDPGMQNMMGQLMSGGMASGGNSMEGLLQA